MRVGVWEGGGCEGDLLAGTDLHTSEWIQVITDSAARKLSSLAAEITDLSLTISGGAKV